MNDDKRDVPAKRSAGASFFISLNMGNEVNIILQVRVWGVRGSCPETGACYREYGGNTSCVTIHTKDQIVIFDAGTGISEFDRSFHKGTEHKQLRLDLLISHLHIDHLMGLFSCSFLYDPQTQLHIYGRRWENLSFQESLCRLFGPPYWPVRLDQLPARIFYHEITAESRFSLGDQIQVRSFHGYHPGGSILYRLDVLEKEQEEAEPVSVVYGLDCELTEEILTAYAEFAKDCNLLICDACYTKEELTVRQGWGHGSMEQCQKLRHKSGAKQALFMHYARNYQDSFLREKEKQMQAQDPACIFAKEGMVLKFPFSDGVSMKTSQE